MKIEIELSCSRCQGTNIDKTGQWHYFLRDHRGNTRVDFAVSGTTTASVQDYHYYPFGMDFTGMNSAVSDNKLKYNGKKQQDDHGLDWYDYGARFYDAELAVFHTVDPLAEDYNYQSPYVYAANNPIRFIDWMGMSADDLILKWANESSKEKFKNVSEAAMGNKVSMQIDEKTGKTTISFNEGESMLTLNEKELSFYNVMSEATDTNLPDVEVNLTDHNDPIFQDDAIIGNYSLSLIDMDDVKAFDNVGILNDPPVVSAAGTLAHEVNEMTNMQRSGISGKQSHLDYGIPAENSVNGSVRSPQAVKQKFRINNGCVTFGTVQEEYRRNSTVYTLFIRIKNDNIQTVSQMP